LIRFVHIVSTQQDGRILLAKFFDNFPEHHSGVRIKAAGRLV
jgi:hypothetical protein